MPRGSDPEARKREIVDVAIMAVGEGGFQELSLRRLARRLGGSVARVTHYFATRDDLIDGMLETARVQAREETDALAQIENPVSRLVATLCWVLPLHQEGLTVERARLALLPERHVAAVHQFIEGLEPTMRGVFSRGVKGVVPLDALEDTVELLRVWCNGIALSAVEHPEIWTAQRQLRAARTFLGLLGVPVEEVDQALREQAPFTG